MFVACAVCATHRAGQVKINKDSRAVYTLACRVKKKKKHNNSHAKKKKRVATAPREWDHSHTRRYREIG